MTGHSYAVTNRRRIIAGAGLAVAGGVSGCLGARQETTVVYVEKGIFESISSIDRSHPFGSLNLDSFRVTIAPQAIGVELYVIDDGGNREMAAYLPAGRTAVSVDRSGVWSLPVDVEARDVDGELLGHARIVEVA